jgi:5-methylcytosine-specific restriction endonuclease McrA
MCGVRAGSGQVKPPSKRTILRKQQANQCYWCGKPIQRRHPERWDYNTIEHLTPRSKGGTNDIENLALAHKKCNAERGVEDREPLLRRVAAPT